jgi:predicted small lipoprotein YifL
MKKLFKSLIALMLIICTLLAVSSCGARPQLDLGDAEDALEDEDYLVTYNDDSEEPGIVESLYAYGDEEFLCIVVYETSKMANLAYEAIELKYKQEIETIKLQIKTIKYTLNQFDRDMDSDEIDDLEDELKDLEKELEEAQDEYVIGKSGKTVWYGTKRAIEDSKG